MITYDDHKLKKYKKLLVDKTELGKLATFYENKKLPVYNWFYYKEAFSRGLVVKILEKYKIRNGVVLDPFCGAGTTLLTCKEMGVNSVGFDVLPVSVFSAVVKTRDYDIDVLKEHIKNLLKMKFSDVKNYAIPLILKKAFDSTTLKRIFFYHEKINEIGDFYVRGFLKLALINAAMSVSFAYRDGAVIKFRKRKTMPFKVALKRNLKRMIREYKYFTKNQIFKTKTYVGFGDARSLPLKNNSVNAIITSPPYLGQPDYQRAYEIENTFIEYYSKKSSPNFIDSESSEGYFKDMHAVLKELHRVCKLDSPIAFVVANAYIDKNVECDLIISKIAEDLGFEVRKIFVLNKRYALKNRTKKVGVLRESLIEMVKI